VNADSHQSGTDPIGSAAEEALRLAGALAGWASEHVAGASEHLATGAAECTVCPICRTVHAIREVSPEVRDHLVAAGASLLQAFTGLVTAAGAAAGAAGGHSSSRTRHPDVERIHVDTRSGDDPGAEPPGREDSNDQSINDIEVEWPDV